MKNSPILALDQLKSSNPNIILNQKEDSNLSKEIKINSTNNQAKIENVSINRNLPKITKLPNPVDNNYNIPINNFAMANPASPRP